VQRRHSGWASADTACKKASVLAPLLVNIVTVRKDQLELRGLTDVIDVGTSSEGIRPTVLHLLRPHVPHRLRAPRLGIGVLRGDHAGRIRPSPAAERAWRMAKEGAVAIDLNPTRLKSMRA